MNNRFLEVRDVITAHISDHNPMIKESILFWNVMMKGKQRGRGFNNGFGIVETESQYINRLIKVAGVIAEIIHENPSIETIGLCEGPIEPVHVKIFLDSIKKFKWMERFFVENAFYKPNVEKHPNWGLLMLTDKDNKVSEMKCDLIQESPFDKLTNRFQLWKLTNSGKKTYFALAHFPFGGDECVSEKKHLSHNADTYCELIINILNQYSNDHLIFCADFNFNPYLISQWKDRILDQITPNNSILLTVEGGSRLHHAVTVDGILLSIKEKQKSYESKIIPRLFDMLKNEYRFFKSTDTDLIEENRHNDFSSQKKI
jgi:hypothetical protein